MATAPSGRRRRSRFAACRKCAGRLLRLLPPASVLPGLLGSPAWAAEFELRPSVSVGQYYTDNVNLAPRGQELSDWVTQATPTLTFNYNGAKLRFFATASVEFLYRANEGSLEAEPHLNSGTVGSMEIVPQFLFLDSQTTVRQENNSVLGRQALNNINTTNDRSTVQTTALTPYIRYSFGSEAQTELRYTYSMVDNNGAGGRGSTSGGNRIDARVTSGPAYKRTTWNVAYLWQRIDYDIARDTTTESIKGSVRHLITPSVGVLANVGYEDNDYLSTTTSPKGSFWSLGFDWTPTPRTTFAVTTGERYYGKTYSLDFSHRSRLTVWNANYTEEITSYREQALVPLQTDTASYLDALYRSRFPDPIERQQAVNEFIRQSGLPPTLIVPINILTDQTYLQKTWRGSVGLQGPRHTFFVNGFSMTKESQSAGLPIAAGDFAAASTVKQTGGGLVWNWRIAQQDSSNMSLGYSRSDTPGLGRTDNTKYFRASYSHQFSQNMSGTLNYHRLDNDSNVANSGYTENQVSALLRMSF